MNKGPKYPDTHFNGFKISWQELNKTRYWYYDLEREFNDKTRKWKTGKNKIDND